MAAVSTAITIALSVLAVLIIVIAALAGLRRGVILSAVKVGVTALSALLSFVVCRLCMSLFTKKLGSLLLTKLSSVLPEKLSDLLGSGSIALDITAGFIAALLAPVFFVIFYLLIKLIVDIIASIVCKLCGLRRKLNGFGALIGAVNGVLIALIVFVPLTGLVITAQKVTGSISELDSENEAIENVRNIHEEIVKPVSDSFCIRTLSKLGSKSVFDALTVYTVDGTKINASEEVGTLSACLTDCGQLLNKSPSAYGRKEGKALRNLSETLEKSNVVPMLAAEVVRDAGSAWKDGKAYLGIDAPKGGELFTPVLDAIFRISSKMTAENAKEDVSTLLGITATIVEHETLSCVNDSNALMKNLSQKNYISSMLTELSGNERMKSLTVELMNLSVRAVADTMNVPESSQTVFNTLMADVAGSVSDKRGIADANERLQALSVALAKDFKKAGSEITNAQATVIAFYLLEDFGGGSEVNAEKIENFFKEAGTSDQIVFASSAKESGAQRLRAFLNGEGDEKISYSDQNGTEIEIVCENKMLIVTVTTVDEGGKTSKKQESLPAEEITNVIDNLSTPENFKTDVHTLADMLIDEEKLDQIENPEEEFKKIEDGIVGLLEFTDTVKNDTKFEDMDVSLLGDSMQNLLGSELMKDSVVGMVESILKSDVVKEAGIGESAPIDYILENIKGGENADEDFDLANALETAQKTAIITNNTGDEEENVEKRTESVQWLIENMSASSAKMLKEMVSAEFLTQNGVPAANAAAAAELLGRVFDGMQKSDSMTKEQYKAEADAINHLYKIAQNASSSAATLFDAAGKTGALGSADALIDGIMQSKVVTGAIVDTAFTDGQKKVDFMGIGAENVTKSDKAAAEKALNDYYCAHKDAETGRKLEAIAALLTLDWNA